MVNIGNDWDELLKDEWDRPYYKELRSFLREEYKNETVYPPAEDIFTALRLTPYAKVKVVILGQDPYHEPGQAVGLAFSVPRGMKMPPSLENILKELANDAVSTPGFVNPGKNVDASGLCRSPETSDGRDHDTDLKSCDDGGGILAPWADQGVLLLNTVLTVRAHQAGSHRGAGWEQFTDRVIELLAARKTPMVFVLWGAQAISKKELIIKASTADKADAADADSGIGNHTGSSIDAGSGAMRHLIITAPHPSPLSAYRGFFGGRYFSRCNYFLEDNGIEPIDWDIS